MEFSHSIHLVLFLYRNIWFIIDIAPLEYLGTFVIDIIKPIKPSSLHCIIKIIFIIQILQNIFHYIPNYINHLTNTCRTLYHVQSIMTTTNPQVPYTVRDIVHNTIMTVQLYLVLFIRPVFLALRWPFCCRRVLPIGIAARHLL